MAGFKDLMRGIAKSASKEYDNPYANTDLWSADDPNLEAAQNQLKYYNDDLQRNYITPNKPSILKKLGSGSLKALEILTSPLNALWSGATHGINDGLKSGLNGGNILDVLGNTVKGAGKGLVGGLLSPYSSKLAKDNQSLVDVLDTLTDSNNGIARGVGNTVSKLSPGFIFAKTVGVSDESAVKWGKISVDLLGSVFLDPANSISGLSKGMKVINKGADALATTNKSLNYEKALEAVRKVKVSGQVDDIAKNVKNLTGDDHFAKVIEEANKYRLSNSKEADYLLKQGQKAQGMLPDFEGVKIGSKTVLSPETLVKISEGKGKIPALIAGGLMNPAAFALSGVADPIKKLAMKTSLGQGLDSRFIGGKNQAMKNIAKDNPQLQLETLMESRIKEMGYNKKIMNDEARIAETLKNQQDLAAVGKSADDISRVIENPTEKELVTRETEEEVFNPDYIEEAKNFNQSKINSLDAELQKRRDVIVKAEKKGKYTPEQLVSMKKEYEGYKAQVKEIKQFAKDRTYKFSSEVTKTKLMDTPNIDKLPKNLLTDPVESLSRTTDEVAAIVKQSMNVSDSEAKRIAVQIKMASDNVKDAIDEVSPGLSKSLKSGGSTTIGDVTNNPVRDADEPPMFDENGNNVNFGNPRKMSTEDLIEKKKDLEKKVFESKKLQKENPGKYKLQEAYGYHSKLRTDLDDLIEELDSRNVPIKKTVQKVEHESTAPKVVKEDTLKADGKKRPFEMSKIEYETSGLDDLSIAKSHLNVVKKALKDGLEVPQSVLEEHGLAKKVKAVSQSVKPTAEVKHTPLSQFKKAESDAIKESVDAKVAVSIERTELYDSYMKQNSKDLGGGKTKSRAIEIDDLHTQLNYPKQTKARIDAINSMNNESADTYIKTLKAQINKRKILTSEGKVFDMDAKRSVPVNGYIQKLSDESGIPTRFDVEEPGTYHVMKIIEKTRLEREAGYAHIGNKKPIKEVEKLYTDLMKDFGSKYPFLKEAGNDTMLNLRQLSNDEFRIVQEALKNTHQVPVGDVVIRSRDFLMKNDNVKTVEAEQNLDRYGNKREYADMNADKGKVDLKKQHLADVVDSIKETYKVEDIADALYEETDEILQSLAQRGDTILNIKDNSVDIDSLSREQLVKKISDNNMMMNDSSVKQKEMVTSMLSNMEKFNNTHYKDATDYLSDKIMLAKEDVKHLVNLKDLDTNFKNLDMLNPNAAAELRKVMSFADMSPSNVQKLTDNIAKVTAPDVLKNITVPKEKLVEYAKDLDWYAKKMWKMYKDGNESAKSISQELWSFIKSGNLNNPSKYQFAKDLAKKKIYELEHPVIPKNNPMAKFANTKHSYDFGKEITTLNFDVDGAKISVDENMTPEMFDSFLKSRETPELDTVKKNSTTTVINDIITKEKEGLAGMANKDKTILTALNPDLKRIGDHELGHVAFNLNTGKATKTIESLNKALKNLSGKKAQKLVDIIETLDTKYKFGTSIEGLKNGHISSYAEGFADKTQYNTESLAELTSLLTIGDSVTRDSIEGILGKDVINKWYDTLDSIPMKDIRGIVPEQFPLRDEIVGKLQKTKAIMNMVGQKNIKSYADIAEQMNILEQISDAEIIKQFVESGEAAAKGIPEFITLKNTYQTIVETMDNWTTLDDVQKRIGQSIMEDFKEMRIKEGVVTNEDITGISQYMTHMLNSTYKDSVKTKGVLKGLGLDFSDSFNIFDTERKLKGTIESINKFMKEKHGLDNFFETNALKIHLMRGLKHEQIMYNNKELSNMMDLFGHKIIKFDELNSMSLDDIKKLANDKGFESIQAKLPTPDKQSMKYVETNVPRNTKDGVTEIPYKMLPSDSDKAQKEMYINGYKKWVTEQFDNDYVAVTMNQTYESKQIRTVADEKLNKAHESRLESNEALRGLEEGLDDTKKQILNSEIDKPYTQLKLSDLVLEDVFTKSNNDLILLPRGVSEEFLKQQQKQFKKDKDGLLAVYDKFLNMFKAQAVFSGGFHVNNTVGNIFNSYTEIGGEILNPRKAWTAKKILSGKDGMLNGHTYQEIREKFQELGLTRTFFEEDMRGGAQKYIDNEAKSLFGETKSPLRKLADKINPLDTENNIFYKTNQKIGGKIESQGKMHNFIHHLEAGKSFEEAADLANKVQFDYSDLTDFEINTMKRIVPFYTFMRKNIPFQIEQMAEQPGRYSKVAQFYKDTNKNESDEERVLKPDSVKDQVALGKGKYFKLQLPALDINKLQSSKDIYGMLTPVLKTPLDLIYNRNNYTDQKIGDKLSEKAGYAASNLVPAKKTAETVFNAIKIDATKEEKSKLTSLITGVKVSSPDFEMQRKVALYNYIEQLQEQYYGAKDKGLIADKTVAKNPIKKLTDKYVAKQ